MKVLQINIFGNLSTGKIAVDLYRTLVQEGHEGVVAFARNNIAEDVPYIKIGNRASVYCDGILTRFTDKAGFYSKAATKKLIQKIDEYNPDIIHLHNIHGYYLNIEILFEYLKACGKPVVWTLHDCWAFTGHCCYYSMAKCDKWQNECFACEQKHSYPASLFVDNSTWNYHMKKELFTSIPNLHLVTVSKWLEGEVQKSFLKDIPCTTIYNGIDLDVFKPTETDFRRRYGLENKKIVLGVASTWDTRKGFNDFLTLSTALGDDYRIVLVGIDSRQKKQLNARIIGIDRTNSMKELAGIYSTADVFFNASVEETFGLPTVEALACGTPAIVYNATALPETVGYMPEYICEPHDISGVVEKIENVLGIKEKVNYREFAIPFEKNKQFGQYIQLYESLLQN